MKEINSPPNLTNFKKKEKKFSSEKPMMKIEKKDSEEPLMKSKDIIDVLLKHVKGHMARKVHSISISKSSMLNFMNSWIWEGRIILNSLMMFPEEWVQVSAEAEEKKSNEIFNLIFYCLLLFEIYRRKPNLLTLQYLQTFYSCNQ